ncbi:MAG: restriction endonuclease subunit S [Candidatus Gracilibacteria bacterium]
MYPTKKLFEVCEIINGGTPDTTIQEYWSGGIFWITPKDMGQLGDIYVSDTSRTITQSGVDNSSVKIVPINSVILSSRAPIGHLAINTVPMCTNQGCKGLVPGSELNYIYLYYFLLNSRDLLNSLGSGTTFKELSSTKLKEVEIPLPPLSTQSKIVAKLDEVFGNIDSQISLLKANIEDVERVGKSVMEESFQGEEYEKFYLGSKNLSTDLATV